MVRRHLQITELSSAFDCAAATLLLSNKKKTMCHCLFQLSPPKAKHYRGKEHGTCNTTTALQCLSLDTSASQNSWQRLLDLFLVVCMLTLDTVARPACHVESSHSEVCFTRPCQRLIVPLPRPSAPLPIQVLSIPMRCPTVTDWRKASALRGAPI